MPWIALICVTLLATVAGCAVVDWIFGPPGPDYAAGPYSSELEMPFVYSRGRFSSDSAWIGRHSDELVESLGEPDLILEARPRFADYRDGIPKISYVYRAEPGARSDRSTCIDAFVVLQATGEIVDYYCR